MLPFDDHVTRWCKSNLVDGEDVGISAFMLKDKDEDDALSVNWLEFLKCPDRKSEILEVQTILSQKMRKVSRNSRIAVLNVEDILRAVDECLNGKLKVAVLHNPDSGTTNGKKWDDPSHSGIYGLTRDVDQITAATALRDKIKEIYPATPI